MAPCTQHPSLLESAVRLRDRLKKQCVLKFGKADSLDFKVETSLLVQGYLACGPLAVRVSSRNVLFTFCLLFRFTLIISAQLLPGHPAKIKTWKGRVEVFIEREGKQQQTLQRVPPPLNSRRKKNIEMVNAAHFAFNIPLIMQVLHFPRCTEWHNGG